ncbi:SH3 domain-containing protein [Turneriella parva]|uniref:SH3b domain-containing protein n=1 Tax=Turneriella parva (strain ATCC BAA-1111 / DSM 21527 / NCTC 11395 / H) TaxID=869212 RepID=I4B4F4_TURPD|nr:SH3 domain-containing protein [Turneriella parva]AFM12161.1 hypothetical protein Turpa_1513 [Turneriella parva DSM 21527]
MNILAFIKNQLILGCGLCLFAGSLLLAQERLSRPQNVPRDATPEDIHGKHTGNWSKEEISGLLKITQFWNQKGIRTVLSVEHGDIRKGVSYDPINGSITVKWQSKRKADFNFHIYGKETTFRQFNKNRFSQIAKCWVVLPQKATCPTCVDDSTLCGEEIEYNLDGSVKSRKQHPHKCLQGCGEFKPFMPPGKYKVHATNVILRDKPSTKGKSLGTLQKGTELQVIEDTHKIETHEFETAPWVKVRVSPSACGTSPACGGGREGEGYVFGGFLDSLERNDL